MQQWQGKHLKVEILFSAAGVATQSCVSNAGGLILVDAGDGCLRDLLDAGIDPEQVDGILFTHGHFDHVAGLYSLLRFWRMMGREREVKIVIPRGCDPVVRILRECRETYGDRYPLPIEEVAVDAGDTFMVGGMEIEIHSVIHCGSVIKEGIQNPVPAVGYRVSCEGETAAFSGDTGYCQGLLDLVTDADLAVIEATFPDDHEVPEGMYERVHLSESLAAKAGAMAREHLLIHKITKWPRRGE